MRKVSTALLVILLVTVFHFSDTDAAEEPFSPYVEDFTDGRIDWDNGIVFGMGRGYLHLNGGSKQKAFRAAQTAALQSILKIASGLRLNDRETLKELGGGRVALQLRALIRYKEDGYRFHEDTETPYFEVTRKVNLKGIDGLTANLLHFFQSTEIPWNAFPQSPPKQEKEPDAAVETWLVLNVGKKEIKPALFPRILDEAGRVIYQVDDVHQAALEAHGMARYVESDIPIDRLGATSALEKMVERVLFGLAGPAPAFAEEKTNGADEKADRRRKRRKYVVKDVTAAEGLMKTNLVISESDARDLKKQHASSQILKKCRVIIVVNSPLGGVEGVLDSFYTAGVGE